MKTYLIHLIHSCLNFRSAEIDALCEMLHAKITYEIKEGTPFCIVKTENGDSLSRVVSRSVLSRYAFEIWAAAGSYSELFTKVKTKLQDYQECFKGKPSYRFSVESFGRTLSQDYKVERIEEFGFLPLKGAVKLKDPEIEFCVVEYYTSPRDQTSVDLKTVFFGKMIAHGCCRTPYLYDLKHRKYIGNTSMDPLMSFLMNNIGKVRQYDLVYDPFVGSGESVCSSSHRLFVRLLWFVMCSAFSSLRYFYYKVLISA
ncbi:unnamed protein product [Soboliphyme baturini]|uniref:THUMP domain-containing protein n=1 Tax=Soboliphyme baturini TaxID=241478 RepID=A0A183IUG8_9BILA|nr:unnamed protein product [Soboliphyme baturini]